jgi:hypothetical protein
MTSELFHAVFLVFRYMKVHSLKEHIWFYIFPGNQSCLMICYRLRCNCLVSKNFCRPKISPSVQSPEPMKLKFSSLIVPRWCTAITVGSRFGLSFIRGSMLFLGSLLIYIRFCDFKNEKYNQPSDI